MAKMELVDAKNKIAAHIQNARNNLDTLEKQMNNSETNFQLVEAYSYIVGNDMNMVEKLARRVD